MAWQATRHRARLDGMWQVRLRQARKRMARRGEVWQVWQGSVRHRKESLGRLGKLRQRAVTQGKAGNLNGTELKTLRKKLGLSLAQASRQVEVSARTWARWEAGERRIPPGAVKLFQYENKVKP